MILALCFAALPAPVRGNGTDAVVVPAATFSMGGGDELDERPAHRVSVSSFRIDRREVSRMAYGACAAAGACPANSHKPADDRAVAHVTWTAAAAYCRFAGGRLPTEAEWELAARGTDGRIYPWGDELTCDRANFGNYGGEGRCPANPGAVLPGGRFPRGDSPLGVQDLAGNVWEWVADWYDATYYHHSPTRDPKGPARGERRVLRGGACCSLFGLPRAGNRLAFPPDFHDDDIGFRCAYELAAPQNKTPAPR